MRAVRNRETGHTRREAKIINFHCFRIGFAYGSQWLLFIFIDFALLLVVAHVAFIATPFFSLLCHWLLLLFSRFLWQKKSQCFLLLVHWVVLLRRQFLYAFHLFFIALRCSYCYATELWFVFHDFCRYLLDVYYYYFVDVYCYFTGVYHNFTDSYGYFLDSCCCLLVFCCCFIDWYCNCIDVYCNSIALCCHSIDFCCYVIDFCWSTFGFYCHSIAL